MCTLNITLSDTLMNRIRPSFPSQQALLAYAQKQLEIMFTQFAEKQTQQADVLNEGMASALNFIDSLAVPGGHDIPLSEDSIASLSAQKY